MHKKERKKELYLMDEGINFRCKSDEERQQLKEYLTKKKMQIIQNHLNNIKREETTL
jgi:hypothetical protein